MFLRVFAVSTYIIGSGGGGGGDMPTHNMVSTNVVRCTPKIGSEMGHGRLCLMLLERKK